MTLMHAPAGADDTGVLSEVRRAAHFLHVMHISVDVPEIDPQREVRRRMAASLSQRHYLSADFRPTCPLDRRQILPDEAYVLDDKAGAGFFSPRAARNMPVANAEGLCRSEGIQRSVSSRGFGVRHRLAPKTKVRSAELAVSMLPYVHATMYIYATYMHEC